jgi:hypothetical protein
MPSIRRRGRATLPRDRTAALTNRWFTHSQPDALAVAPTAFTELEQATIDQIRAFARKPENKTWELMHCLDAGGFAFHDKSSGLKQAEITEKMKDAMRAGEGVRLWHNHPSGQSLSHHDWNVAACCPTVEVLAVSEHGSIFVGRIPEWDDAFQAVIEKLSRIGADLEFRVSRICREEEVRFELTNALSTLTGHFSNLAVGMSSVGNYAFSLADRDQQIFDEAASLDIVRRAVRYGVNEIQSVISEFRAGPAPRSDQPSR